MKAIVDALNESNNLAIWVLQGSDVSLATSARAVLRKSELAVTRLMELRKENKDERL
jgi:cob(I)alamin adenosyltransferase